MLPQSDKKIFVANGKKAYQGIITATKNIDLSESGYIKLAAPMCRILSSNMTGLSGLANLVYDLFRWSAGNFKLLTAGTYFNFSLATLNGVVTEEGSRSGSEGIRAVQWVGNEWFVNGVSNVESYNGSSVSSTWTTRISNNLGFIENFVSRNSLVGRDEDNYNIVKQYNSSFSGTTDLTLPANFVVTGIAYSGNQQQVAIATKQRKNEGKAVFVTWDGTTTAANAEVPVDDPYILDIAAYDTSWVILTFSGQLLIFNGGGFDELGHVAGFDRIQSFINLSPISLPVLGKIIHVSGNKIYLNLPSLPESSVDKKPYTPFAAGGVYCYDPEHGLYHTASPSYSLYKSNSVTFTSNIGSSTSHGLETGDELWDGTTISYAIKVTDDTFKVATTYENAIVGTATTISDGSHAYFWVNRTDYGTDALKIEDLGVVKRHPDFTGYSSSGAIPFFAAAKLHPGNLGTTRISSFCAAVPIMHNRGHFVIGKWQSQNLEDSWHGVAIRYSKLKSQDMIIAKAKITENDPIVVGDQSLFSTAAYTGKGALWDGSGMYFTTTEDLTDAEIGDEVYVFAGPGAGQSAHIKEINGSVDDGWEVILDEKIRGTVSGRVSCVTIDHFKKLGVITKNDRGTTKKLYLKESGGSSIMETKVELRGIDVKVAGVLPIASPRMGA